MNPLNYFDSSRFFIGVLCQRKHQYQESKLSLRYIKNKQCAECKRQDAINNSSRRRELLAQQTKEFLESLGYSGNFDFSRLYLGSLCSKYHDWNGTGKSLRRLKSNGQCVECELALKKYKKDHLPNVVKEYCEQFVSNDLYFDPKKFFLGDLCKYKHQFQDKDYSLRYHCSGACVVCSSSARKEKYYSKKLDVSNKVQFSSYAGLAKCYLGLLCKQNHNFENSEKSLRYFSNSTCVICARQAVKEHERKNPTWKQKYYAPGGKEKARLRVRRRYARKRNNHHVKYSDIDIQNRRHQFNNCCAYCGIDKRITDDHFIPLFYGGSDCIGNIIPACLRCNDSKGILDPKYWFELQPFYSHKQWKYILRILGKTEKNYNQIPLL